MGDLRLATACAGLNKKALVAAIVEANWNTLRVKKKMKKCRRGLSTLGELTPEQTGRIKKSVQEACQAEGLGSMMVNIRMRVSDAMGIDCSKGAALRTCDKAICKLLRTRALPGRTVEVCAVHGAADKRREQVGMAKAEFESQCGRLLHILEGPRPDQEAEDRRREWKAMTVEDMMSVLLPLQCSPRACTVPR